MLKNLSEEHNVFMNKLIKEFKEFKSKLTIKKREENKINQINVGKKYISIHYNNYSIKANKDEIDNKYLIGKGYFYAAENRLNNKNKYKVFLFFLFLFCNGYVSKMYDNFLVIKDNKSDLYLYITSDGKFIDSELTMRFVEFLKLDFIFTFGEDEVFLNKNNKKLLIEKMDFYLNSKEKDLFCFKYKDKRFFYNKKTNKYLINLRQLNKNHNIPDYIISKIKIFLKETDLNLYDIKKDEIIISTYGKFLIFVYNNLRYILFNNKIINKTLNLNKFKLIENSIKYNNVKYSLIKDINNNNLILLKENEEPIILHSKSKLIKENSEVQISKGTSFLLIGNQLIKIINHTGLNFLYYSNINEKQMKFSIIPSKNENNKIFFLNNEIYIIRKDFYLFDKKDMKQTYKNLVNNIKEIIKENNKCVFENNF
jgi:hypothetical protein